MWSSFFENYNLNICYFRFSDLLKKSVYWITNVTLLIFTLLETVSFKHYCKIICGSIERHPIFVCVFSTVWAVFYSEFINHNQRLMIGWFSSEYLLSGILILPTICYFTLYTNRKSKGTSITRTSEVCHWKITCVAEIWGDGR